METITTNWIGSKYKDKSSCCSQHNWHIYNIACTLRLGDQGKRQGREIVRDGEQEVWGEIVPPRNVREAISILINLAT